MQQQNIYSGKTIDNVEILTHDKIRFNFDDGKSMVLTAESEYPYISWFELNGYNLEELEGRTITTIENIKSKVDNSLLPEVHKDDYSMCLLYNDIRNCKIKMSFVDDKPFYFYIRNKSNGYYDGWLSISETGIKDPSPIDLWGKYLENKYK